MKAFVVLVSNGPSIVVTRLKTDKAVANLIWRGFRDFNLYEISEKKLEELKQDIGNLAWETTAEELNDEWPVRVIDRDSSRAFANFQLFADEVPVAKVRNRKKVELNMEIKD